MQYEQHIDLAAIGPLHARTKQFASRLASAKEIVERALSRYESPYMSISGGKDSIAMLGVVATVAKSLGQNVRAWAHVSDASFPGTVETITEACRIADVRLVINESPVSAWDVVGAQSDKRFGKEGYFFTAIRQWLDWSKHDLAFVGVRAAESKRRYKAAKAHGYIFDTTVPAPHTQCHPLQWWSIEDVAAAIHVYGLPIHPIYKKNPCSTMPIRLGYMTSLDLTEMGSAVFLRKNYPEHFARLAQIKPEIRRYV